MDGAGGVFASYSPVDKSKICDVACGTGVDIDKAASAAQYTFAAWRDLNAKARRELMMCIAEGIEARAEEIALCECWDTGQAYKFMSKAALRGAENFRYFADQVVQAPFQVWAMTSGAQCARLLGFRENDKTRRFAM